MSQPSQQLVRSMFHYDPIAGKLYYTADFPPRGKTGQEPGWINSRGYRRMSIGGKELAYHKVIWLWMTGIWPVTDIDHEDNNRSNNIWANLRLASRSQNLMNQGKKLNNTSGFKGVTTRGNSHSVRFRFGGMVIHAGSYSSARVAAEVYDLEVIKYQGCFAKTNKALGLL